MGISMTNEKSKEIDGLKEFHTETICRYVGKLVQNECRNKMKIEIRSNSFIDIKPIYCIKDSECNSLIVHMMEQFLLSNYYKQDTSIKGELTKNIFIDFYGKKFSFVEPTEKGVRIQQHTIKDIVETIDSSTIGNFCITNVESFDDREMLINILSILGYNWERNPDYRPTNFYGTFLKKLTDKPKKDIEYQEYSFEELFRKLLFVEETFDVGDVVYCPMLGGELYNVKMLQNGSLGITHEMSENFQVRDDGYCYSSNKRLYKEPFIYKATPRNQRLLKMRFPHIKFLVSSVPTFNVVKKLLDFGHNGVLVCINDSEYKYVIGTEIIDGERYFTVADKDSKKICLNNKTEIKAIHQDTGNEIIGVFIENNEVHYTLKRQK